MRPSTSRWSARSSLSPSSTLPPGNSQRPGSTASSRRWVMRYFPSRSMTAATTRTIRFAITAHYRYTLGMSVKRVTPPEAAKLIAEGWTYVDVRSIPEFVDGHPAGAYNVPILHLQPGRGMSPNHDFERVMAKHFPKEAQLVVGCRAGPRSYRAAEMLMAAG